MSTPDSFVAPAEMSTAALPIFFLQMGSKTSLFLNKVLQQAALTNGAANVYILTDTNFHLYHGYNCIDISKYAYGSKEFDGLYQHHSTNNYFFEKTCFDRWFMINVMIKELNIGHFLYADCDVLLLENLKPVFNNLMNEGYEGSTMYFENEDGHSITSAHTSFWSSKLLGDFCDFIIQKYRDKQGFDVILRDARAGKFFNNTNVSDMILLDVFRTETRPKVLNLITLEDDNICFDFNIGASYNGHKHYFVMDARYKIKKIKRRIDGLFGLVTGSDKMYRRFYTLHFQGYVTKTLIPLYVNPGGLFNYFGNHLSGNYEFALRKLKLLKNKVKRKLRK